MQEAELGPPGSAQTDDGPEASGRQGAPDTELGASAVGAALVGDLQRIRQRASALRQAWLEKERAYADCPASPGRSVEGLRSAVEQLRACEDKVHAGALEAERTARERILRLAAPPVEPLLVGTTDTT